MSGVDIFSERDSYTSPTSWNLERAKVWHNMKPPSKPSDSEIAIYSKYFEKLKNITLRPKVLILGSTVEFRLLAFRYNCEVTVVDYSKDYHDEISNDLGEEFNKIIKAENFVNCDWCDMASQLIEESFDIIIGDLAIGNVAPENTEKFMSNISKLLNKNGFFLGKTIYRYSDNNLTRDSIKQLLDRTAEFCILHSEIDTDSFVYANTMYDLSLFFSEQCSDFKFCRKIDFKALYNEVYNYVNSATNNELYKKIFKIYLGDDTNFSKKMVENFYIYDYVYILKLAKRYDINLFDVEYSQDYYKDKYPLIVFKKNNQNNITNGGISISSILQHNPQYIDIWSKSIASRFFLMQLGQINDIKSNIIENVRRMLHLNFNANNGCIFLDDNLNFTVNDLQDDAIDSETELLVKGTSLENDENAKSKLKKNYIYCILLHEAFMVGQNDGCLNDVELLLLKELFKDERETCPGHIWLPKDSPWVAAKICICLYPLVVQAVSDLTHPFNKYLYQIKNVVETLCDKISLPDLMWHTELGNKFDTSALCLETLFYYSQHFQSYKISLTIDRILNNFVINDKIIETLIKFPIYDAIILQVLNDQKIDNEYAYKKLCGRIEWYTVLYIICKDRMKDIEDTYAVSAKHIEIALKKFWTTFSVNIHTIYEKTKSKEIGVIPQIMYCIHRSGILESN